MDAEQRAARLFAARFGEPPTHVARAPGRANLIGEHTDYNDGFVLPMAIEAATWLAFRPRPDGRVVCHSAEYAESADFSATELTRPGRGWTVYLEGMARELAAGAPALPGWDGALATDIPIGAGLSSSAALEIVIARAFAAAGGRVWDPTAAASAAQRADNEWVGIRSGIMDQLTSAAAIAGSALLIDCRTLDITPVPVPSGTAVVILDTGTRRDLRTSAYNERQQQCAAGAAHFGVAALRDVGAADLAAGGGLSEVVRRRCRHVVSENARTLEAAAAMRAGDGAALGTLMVESHRSLRDDYEVSSAELDSMVEAALASPGCLGARMMGGGFGGSAVALVEAGRVSSFSAGAAAGYRERTGMEAAAYVSRPAAGASVSAV